MRRIGFILSVGLLLFIGASGIQGFLGDWTLVETPMQRAANLGQLAMAVTGLGAGMGAMLGWAGIRWVALAFVFSVAGTAGLASVGWGGASLLAGFLSAGLGFLIGYALYLGVRRVWEPEPPGGSALAEDGPNSRENDPAGS